MSCWSLGSTSLMVGLARAGEGRAAGRAGLQLAGAVPCSLLPKLRSPAEPPPGPAQRHQQALGAQLAPSSQSAGAAHAARAGLLQPVAQAPGGRLAAHWAHRDRVQTPVQDFLSMLCSDAMEPKVPHLLYR